MITPAEFEHKMKDWRQNESISVAVKNKLADELVSSILKQFGYDSGNNEWRKIKTEFADSLIEDSDN